VARSPIRLFLGNTRWVSSALAACGSVSEGDGTPDNDGSVIAPLLAPGHDRRLGRTRASCAGGSTSSSRALEAWAEIGVVSRDGSSEIREPRDVPSPERVAELEAQLHHDTAAFVDAVAESSGRTGAGSTTA
jgi:hypothetical protein